MEAFVLKQLGGKDPQVLEELIIEGIKAPQIVGITDKFVKLRSLALIGLGLQSLDNLPALPSLKKVFFFFCAPFFFFLFFSFLTPLPLLLICDLAGTAPAPAPAPASASAPIPAPAPTSDPLLWCPLSPLLWNGQCSLADALGQQDFWRAGLLGEGGTD